MLIASQRLLQEVCDEKRFGKLVAAGLKELRNGIRKNRIYDSPSTAFTDGPSSNIDDGLFTAQNWESNWGLAHRILVPAFGPLSIAAMFDDMKDVSARPIIEDGPPLTPADCEPASPEICEAWSRVQDPRGR